MRPNQCLSVGLLFVAAFGCAVQQARGEEPSQFDLAVAKGELTTVKQLLMRDPALANHPSEHGLTPLFVASLGGHTAVAKLLLDHGAKIDFRVLGESPLYRACHEGHAMTASLLLDRGADPNAAKSKKNDTEQTPLDVAIQRVHKETVKTLLEHGVNPNLTAEEYEAAARARIIFGGRQIPLHQAFQKILWARMWKDQRMNGDPARVARAEQQIKDTTEIARMLVVARKTDVHARHPQGGGAALHMAAMLDCLDLAKLLLARGAAVDARTTETPWHRRSARPPDYAFDETPLHIAIRAQHDEMAQFLLKRGADRKICNSLGQTPFDLQEDNPDPPIRKHQSDRLWP